MIHTQLLFSSSVTLKIEGRTSGCSFPPYLTSSSCWEFHCHVYLKLPADLRLPGFLAAIDCVVGSWGPWSSCTSSCGVGSTERSRQVLVPPRNGGTPCPDLKQRRGCFGNNAVCSSAKGENLPYIPLHLFMHAHTPALSSGTY